MGLPRGPLSPGERQVVVLRPHVRRLAVPVLVLLALAAATGAALGRVAASGSAGQVRIAVLPLAAVAAGRWVVPFVAWWNTVIGVTDRRLRSYRGLVRRTGHDLPLHAIVEVSVRQTLLERALRSGTLTVGTGGGPSLVLRDVPEVALVEQALQELIGRATGTAPDVYDRPYAPDGDPHDPDGSLDLAPDGDPWSEPYPDDPDDDPYDDPDRDPDRDPVRADLRGGWRGYADDLLQEEVERERDFPRPQPPARRRFGRRA
jgi:membrane protein YdbS with pleckstrin-like domain